MAERGAFLCGQASSLPGMGGSLLIVEMVEIPQGFLEEAPIQLEGCAREGKPERLPERKAWPKQRPRGWGQFPCAAS